MKMKDIKGEVSQGQYLKLSDGENRIRVVSELTPVWKLFGEGSARVFVTAEGASKETKARKRFSAYVINRANGQLQIAEFGPQIVNQYVDLSESAEYMFEDVPPYDITIKKSGSGKETEYTVMAARTNTTLTDMERALVSAQKPIEQFWAEEAEDGGTVIL